MKTTKSGCEKQDTLMLKPKLITSLTALALLTPVLAGPAQAFPTRWDSPHNRDAKKAAERSIRNHPANRRVDILGAFPNGSGTRSDPFQRTEGVYVLPVRSRTEVPLNQLGAPNCEALHSALDTINYANESIYNMNLRDQALWSEATEQISAVLNSSAYKSNKTSIIAHEALISEVTAQLEDYSQADGILFRLENKVASTRIDFRSAKRALDRINDEISDFGISPALQSQLDAATETLAQAREVYDAAKSELDSAEEAYEELHEKVYTLRMDPAYRTAVAENEAALAPIRDLKEVLALTAETRLIAMNSAYYASRLAKMNYNINATQTAAEGSAQFTVWDAGILDLTRSISSNSRANAFTTDIFNLALNTDTKDFNKAPFRQILIPEEIQADMNGPKIQEFLDNLSKDADTVAGGWDSIKVTKRNGDDDDPSNDWWNFDVVMGAATYCGSLERVETRPPIVDSFLGFEFQPMKINYTRRRVGGQFGHSLVGSYDYLEKLPPFTGTCEVNMHYYDDFRHSWGKRVRRFWPFYKKVRRWDNKLQKSGLSKLFDCKFVTVAAGKEHEPIGKFVNSMNQMIFTEAYAQYAEAVAEKLYIEPWDAKTLKEFKNEHPHAYSWAPTMRRLCGGQPGCNIGISKYKNLNASTNHGTTSSQRVTDINIRTSSSLIGLVESKMDKYQTEVQFIPRWAAE